MLSSTIPKSTLVYYKRFINRNISLGIFLFIWFLFLILPAFTIIEKAFIHNGNFTLEFFQLLFSNDTYLRCIRNSVFLAIFATLLASIIAIPLASINSRFNYFGKSIFSGLILFPLIMPPFVGAIGIQKIFSRFGSFNILLQEIFPGSEITDWLNPDHSFWLVVMLQAFHLFPIIYLNLISALANIDPSYEEAASTLGIKPMRRFLQISWPLARPGYFAGAIIVFIWAFTDLGTPLLLSYNENIAVAIFNMITSTEENPAGYAMVCLVMLTTIILFTGMRRFVPQDKYQMLARGHVGSLRRNAPLFTTLFIYLFNFMTIGFAILPHIGVLITSISDNWYMTILPKTFSLGNFRVIFEDQLSLTGMKNSLLFAGVATLINIVVGFWLAYSISRKTVSFTAFLDSLVMLPLAIPGIILAFGYVITYSNTILDPLENPVWLLIIAYSVRRLPFMVRSLTAGFSQSSRSLEEASYCFGASKFYTLWKISFPLLFANVVAGAILCFSYAVLDVSDSLILAMKDRFYPLTKAIYVLYQEQGSGDTLASALSVLTLVFLATCLLVASAILGKKMGELFKT